MNEQRFPESFLFGAATSAYQIEGAYDEDGRGKTWWDMRNRDEQGRPIGDSGDVACDHYHRFREDIALMKELGLQTYRFSISWVRIFPEGHGKPNPKGVAFYQELIDTLLANGIQPAVTIWHGDLPYVYDQKGGWKNSETVEHYLEYARFLFETFGDRVKLWFTHNEPWCSAFLGGEPFDDELLIAHNLLVAHAKAVRLYRSLSTGDGEIGIVLNLSRQYPATYSYPDVFAARNVDGFINRWFLDPVLKGRYPEDMVALYRSSGHQVPDVPEDEKLWRENKSDFLGINVYSRGIQRYDSQNKLLFAADVQNEKAAYTEMGWEVAPESLYDLLFDLKNEYEDVPIYITENGAAFKDETIRDGVVQDDDRVAYLRGNLESVLKAIRHKVPVKGYFVWSLFDNFEWGLGYSKRFGIVRVDYDTQKRTPKKSARVYQEILKRRSL